MVEFIKLARKRGVIAGILHASFNILYAGAVLALAILFPLTPWPALVLVLLSKWRVVAVRPRFWWANILSNLPDLLLGFGLVVLMWVGTVWPVQVALAVLYALWLVVVKPQHKQRFVMIQAGLSQFVALTALFAIDYILPVWAVVLITFAIGFATARQVLGVHEETSRAFLSVVWGLILAELSFIAWHWTIAYQLAPTLKIAQFAIIAAALGFVAERSYIAWRDDEKITWNEIKWPVAFAGALILVLLLFFSGLWDASTL